MRLLRISQVCCGNLPQGFRRACTTKTIYRARSFIVGSYSFVCNVLYARDPRETRIYAADTASEEQSSIHQPTTHTYRNAVIFVHVD
jgi:hypothetical protein